MADRAPGSSSHSRRSGHSRHGFDSSRSSHRQGSFSRDAARGHGRGGRGKESSTDGARDSEARRYGRSERSVRFAGGRHSDRSARRGGARDGAGSRGSQQSRPPQRARVFEPSLPKDVEASDLEASARRELRGLGRANAENVARHLVMVQRLLDTDPQLAYKHARYACSHAGRIAVVREAAAIAGYLSEHYQDALRDLRAARRLSGLDLHRAIEADCERALGHLDRALKAAEGADPSQLDDLEEAEIAMVVSSIRHEMGQTELGLIVIEEAIMMFRGDRETRRRLHSVRADRLEELGRLEEAQAVRERIGEATEPETPEVEVFDLEEEYEEEAVSQEASQSVSDDAEHTVEAIGDEVEGDSTDALEDEAQEWSGDFASRVEEELTQILADAGIEEPRSGDQVGENSSAGASEEDSEADLRTGEQA